MKRLHILASVSLLFSASSFAAELTAEVPKGDPDCIAKATSAAPADIAKDATFVRVADGFKLTTLKEGNNGWTCTVNSDGTPWCADAARAQWFKAIIPRPNRQIKPASVHMMAGDNGTTNHAPYATDKSHWVKTGHTS